MKTIMKLALASMIIAVVFSACSRTRDAVGLDTIENFVRTGQWKSVKQSTPAGAIELIPEGGYAEFKNDDKIHYFDSNGNQVKLDSYAFTTSTKKMTYNGVEYEIKENFISTMKTVTLLDGSGNTVITFYRDRQ